MVSSGNSSSSHGETDVQVKLITQSRFRKISASNICNREKKEEDNEIHGLLGTCSKPRTYNANKVSRRYCFGCNANKHFSSRLDSPLYSRIQQPILTA